MAPSAPTVLLLLDSDADAALCRGLLTADPTWEGTVLVGEAAASNASAGEPTCCRSDWANVDVVVWGQRTYAHPQTRHWLGQNAPSAGCVVLLEDADEAQAAAILAMGAQDYLVKTELNGIRLRCTVGTRWQPRQRERQLAGCPGQDIFRQAAIGVSQADPSGRFVRVNQRFCDLLGYTEAELLQLTYQAVTHPDDLLAQARLTQQLLSREIDTVTLEKRYLTRDGGSFWVRIHLSMVEDDAQNIVGDLALVEDISDRKQTELALQESQARFKGMFDQAAVGISLMSVEGKILSVNQWLCDFLGYTQAELEQMPAATYSHPDDQAQDDALMVQLTAGEIADFTLEKRYIHRSGELRWVSLTISLVRGTDGQPLHDIAIVQDIRARKAAELALRESERRYAVLANSAPVGIYRTDVNGDYVYLNPKYCELAGLTIAEGLGSGWLAALHPEDRERAATAWGRATQEQTDFSSELRFLRPDGTVVWFISQAVPEVNIQGQITGYVGTATDISDRKRAEIELRQNQEQLQLTLDFTGIGAWTWYPPTGEYVWSGLLETLLDLPSGLENMYQLWRDRIHPEDVERVEASINQALATHTAFSEEYRYYISDACLVWRWVKGQGCYTETGELDRVLGVVQDIEPFKRLEQELIASKNQLSGILNNTNACIVSFRMFTDSTCHYDYYSPGSQWVYGYSPEMMQEDLNLWSSRVVAEDFETIIAPEKQRILAGKSDGNFEYRYRYPDDSIRWIRESYTTRWEPDQNCWVVISVGVDISDRKVAEQALANSEQELHSIFSNAPSFIAKINQDGIIQFLNRAAPGYTVEQLIGLNIGDFTPPESKVLQQQAIALALATGAPQHIETTGTGAHNTVAYYDVRIAPLSCQAGSDSTAILIATDITERRQAELALQENRDFLQAVLDNLPISLFVKNATPEHFGQYVLVNQTFEAFWDQTRETVIGYTAHDLFAAEQADSFAVKDREIVANGVKQRFHQDLTHHLQGQRVLQTTKVPLHGPDGQPKYLLGISEDITERIAAETALQRSEEQLRLAMEFGNIAIWNWDVASDKAGWNDLAYRLMGYPPETPNISYDIWLQAVHPEDRACVNREIELALAERRAFSIEYRVLHDNGAERWVFGAGQGLYDDAGALLRAAGIMLDITERKQAEAALQRSEEQLRLAVEFGNIAICDWHTGHAGARCNDLAYTLMGYSPESTEISHDDWLQAVHPQEREAAAHEIRSAIAEHRPFAMEYRALHADGTERWVADAGQGIYDALGQVVRVVGVMLDITERKQGELALRESEEKFRQLTENIKQVFFIHDAATRELLYVSPSFAQVWGISCEQLYANPLAWLEPIHPDDLPRLAAAAESADFDELGASEYRLVHPDGAVRWVRSRAFPIYNAEGTLYRIAGIAEDITDFKQAEAQAAEHLKEITAWRHRYAAAGRVGNHLVYDFDISLGRSTWGETFTKFMGFATEPMDMDIWVSWIHPNDRPIFLAAFEKLFDQAMPTPFQNVEYRLRRGTGEYIWVKDNNEPIFDDAGQIVRVIGNLSNITAEKQAAQTLQRLMAGTAGVTGEAFFTVMTKQLAKTLGVSYVTVAKKVGPNLEVIACYQETTVAMPMNYPIAGTPCELVLERGIYAGFQNLQAQFPLDACLVDLHIHNYLGVALTNSQGEVMGVLCALSDRPRLQIQSSETVLRIFAARAAAELERLQVAADLADLNQTLEAQVLERTLALQTQEQELRGIFNQAAVGIAQTDGQTHKILKVNQRFCELIGYSRQELYQLTLEELTYVEDLALSQAALRRLHRREVEDFSMEKRYVTKAGTLLWANKTISIAWNEDNTPAYHIVVIEDITERKQAEKALFESEERLRLALTASNQGLYDLNLATGEAVLSPTYATMLGYDPATFQESCEQWMERLHPDDYERVVKIHQAYVAGDLPDYRMEFRHQTQSGGWKWILSVGQIVAWDQDCNPLRMLGIYTDIDARKQSEVSLQRSLREKEILLKEIHHRVKNNLLVVSSLLELQADYLTDPQAIQYFEDSQHRIQSMALIHEKLYQTTNLAQVDLSDYLDLLLTQLCSAFDAHTHGIVAKLEADSILLNLETVTPCGLIVSELVSNCFRHAFPNGAEGHIWVTAYQNSAQQIVVEVRDDGIGLPTDLDIGQTDSLGLQLVYLLTQQLQGTIQVQRQPGTKFRLVFAELNYQERL
ncbi:MAG: PAS domain S-box protein [Nodosilinea sp.]